MSRARNTPLPIRVHSRLALLLATPSFTKGFAAGLADARLTMGSQVTLAKHDQLYETALRTTGTLSMRLPFKRNGQPLHYGANISIQDLAWEILGVDLEDTPLPRAPAALPTLPKVMPDRRGGQNPRIYGPPWYVHRPAVPYHRPLPTLSHVLPSLNAPQSDFTLSTSTSTLPLLAVNKSLKTLPRSSASSS